MKINYENGIMLSQIYKIKFKEDDISLVKPAQFIFKDNDSTDVIGFVSRVENDDVIIILFTPEELLFDHITIEESITHDELDSLFCTALSENPAMAKEWAGVYYNHEI